MAVPVGFLNYLGSAELEDVVLVDGERAAGGVDVGEGRLGDHIHMTFALHMGEEVGDKNIPQFTD